MSPLQTRLEQLQALGGSDLLLCSGRPAYARKGQLVPLPSASVLDDADMAVLLREVLDEDALNALLSQRLSMSQVCRTLPCGLRVRALCSAVHGGVSAVLRIVPTSPPRLDALGLPKALKGLSELDAGLFVVTGQSGSGRSTTLAALAQQLADSGGRHVVTLEAPVEILLASTRSAIAQRAVGEHGETFATAVSTALALDPDVLVVGDLDAPDALWSALEAACAGVLVLGAARARSSVHWLEHALAELPEAQHMHGLAALSDCLAGVSYQELLHKQGGGRVVASELLLRTPQLASALRERKMTLLPALLAGGRAAGMQTFDASLLALLEAKLIESTDAYAHAHDKKAFARSARLPPA